MYKRILYALMLLPFYSSSQVGIKAGVNFANITNASSINTSSRSGFHAGVFMAPEPRGIIGSRTELIFSKQGYNYKTNTNTGHVNLDYIVIPQYVTINITKFVQVQVGAQMAFLLNAKVDSAGGNGSASNKIMDVYNRFDYGFGGGIEIHPVSGLLIGGRFNISLNDLYKNPSAFASESFAPKVDVKNNVFQLFAGWRFARKGSKK